jgi:hypothetical protein
MKQPAYLCMVIGCCYIATASHQEILVCALHDAPQVYDLIDSNQIPGAYWMDGRPIVLPCGLFRLVGDPRLASVDDIHAWEDPRMADVSDTPSQRVLPCYDLTNTAYLGR